MASMFCKKCGGLLVPVIIEGRRVFKCIRCGEIYEDVKVIVSEEKKSKKEEIQMVSQKEEIKWPIAKEVKCPKCGHQGVYYHVQQTRAADEAPTIIYKCPKCGYTWREYG